MAIAKRSPQVLDLIFNYATATYQEINPKSELWREVPHLSFRF
ncbi:hypothetical protein [Pseudanabaena sp. UWO310]|nr:hypothetical protein [Pseudanabaena sp. UWO310]